MGQLIEFFRQLFDASAWPARWVCGRWTTFHDWLYIVSSIVIGTAYFAIPAILFKFLSVEMTFRHLKVSSGCLYSLSGFAVLPTLWMRLCFIILPIG